MLFLTRRLRTFPDIRAIGLAASRPLACLGLAAVLLTGCKSLPASKPEAAFTLAEAHGAQVFQEHCASCHYATSTTGLKGPGLQALTKQKAMPSGAPPTDERITQTIVHGHGLMQPVDVDDADLPDLLAYLHTL
jgi:mono/diheme cytochrome c family protein